MPIVFLLCLEDRKSTDAELKKVPIEKYKDAKSAYRRHFMMNEVKATKEEVSFLKILF